MKVAIVRRWVWKGETTKHSRFERNKIYNELELNRIDQMHSDFVPTDSIYLRVIEL